jgi:putative transposase
VPIGLVVAGANRNDFKLTQATLASIPIARPAPTPEEPQGLYLDNGYAFREVRDVLAASGFTAHIRARAEEARALERDAGYKARR